MEIRKEELKEFLMRKHLKGILDEKTVGIIMANSKKISHNNELEFFPIIIERKGEFYIIYNCFFKREMIIYNNMESVSISNKNKLHFSVSKNLKVYDFESNLKKMFSNKKIVYIK